MIVPDPEKMRAVRCSNFADMVALSQVLSIEDDLPVPNLETDSPPAGFKDFMLIKVLSVALAPGDVRVLSGKTRELQGPPSMPYTPGGDVCGIVVDVPKDLDGDGTPKCRFQVGDRVAARFLNKPMGCLGEYALVNTSVCGKVPRNISSDDAAALVSSACVAVLIADRIKKDDRVLIFGAGGGVGSHLCQMARTQGASFVAGVGRDIQRLMNKPLSCDQAIDYTTTDPFSVEEWKREQFDVIVDLSCGNYLKLIKNRSSQSSIVKPASKGGRYYTTNPDNPIFQVRSMWQAMKVFLFPALWRSIYSRYGVSRYSLPAYSYVLALPDTSDVVIRTLTLASENKLQACVDPKGPFSFTKEGVEDAFKLQSSYHAKGKVVISVAKE